MKHLFVVRHGSFNDCRINEEGHDQMRDLSKAIKGIVNGSSLYLCCSTVLRAVESAQDISTYLGLSSSPEQVRQFGWEEYGNLHYSSYDLQRKFIRGIEREVGVVIAVTHGPVVENFLRFFPESEWGQPETFSLPVVLPGKGAHLDLERKRYRPIP